MKDPLLCSDLPCIYGHVRRIVNKGEQSRPTASRVSFGWASVRERYPSRRAAL